jgi:hypothetical protein
VKSNSKICAQAAFARAATTPAKVAQDMLECANRDPEFLKTVITGDEPETKVQSSHWK